MTFFEKRFSQKCTEQGQTNYAEEDCMRNRVVDSSSPQLDNQVQEDATNRISNTKPGNPGKIGI